MDFPKILKRKQLERYMSAATFSKHLGMSRAWLQLIYSTNPNVTKSKLSEVTMTKIYDVVGIPMDVMEEYNQSIEDQR